MSVIPISPQLLHTTTTTTTTNNKTFVERRGAIASELLAQQVS